MKLKSALTISLAIGAGITPIPEKQETNFLEGEIINGNFFPSKKWVDFYDLAALLFVNGKYNLVYISGSEILAYIVFDGEYKAYKSFCGRFIPHELSNEDIEELDKLLISYDIHKI